MKRIVLLTMLLVAGSAAMAADFYDTHRLSAADVQLYLRIMHKAADRADLLRARQHPCPRQQEVPRGHQPTAAEISAIVAAANCAASAMSISNVDDAIADEEHAQPHYGQVRDAIEELIQPNRQSRDGVGPVDSGAMCPESWGCMPPGFTPQQQAYWEMQDRFRRDNNRFLQPYRPEIQRLEARVRRIGEEQPNPLAPPTGRQPAPYPHHPMPEQGVGPNGPVRP